MSNKTKTIQGNKTISNDPKQYVIYNIYDPFLEKKSGRASQKKKMIGEINFKSVRTYSLA